MTVRRPLEKKISIDEIISKGGGVLEDNDKLENEWTNINLRIPKKILKQIASELEERIGLSRTAWILESIQEKLRNKS